MTDKYRLVLTSFLMAFVEMLLIRWTSSNIYSLFFFTNFILIASFLGIGIGFLRAKEDRHYFKFSPVLLTLVVVFCYLYSYEYQIKFNHITGDLDYFTKFFTKHVFPVFLTLPIIFTAVTLTMAALADAVAINFRQFPALTAYRLEVFGTLTGISLFALLAYLGLPPLIWGVVIALAYCVLFWSDWLKGSLLLTAVQISMLIVLVGVFYQETINTNHVWSTYYKIQVKEYQPHSYVVNVNGHAQQIIESITQRQKLKPFYFQPYEHMGAKKILDNVLVIGSGTGGDVAIALAQGAKHVDAVEIDRQLYRLGKKLNPNRPYQDPRVSIFINDGRAYLQNTKQKYDLIIYALTDSLMLIPGQSSMRLENYLYTQEGLQAAANHLKPNGTFAIYNYYGLRWFADRLANTLQIIYHQAPCFDTYNENNYWATVITANFNQHFLQCQNYWQSGGQMSETPATDNHPFIYLEENTLTPMYGLALLFIGLLAYYLLRRSGVKLLAIGENLDLFLMGAAFLLLETKSVISYALLFGTTWMVNSLVFIGILLSVSAAIEVTQWFKKINIFVLYVLLLAALSLIWLVPINALLVFPPVLRFILATGLTFTPIFVANLIFAGRFYQTENANAAMGANLIGAVVGGLLEYSSLIIGYQHFALFILGIYTLALVWFLRKRTKFSFVA